ncbi:hypothetical protein NC652_000391 [Populus alba x Populus x berolinensis]|nr:hypothetical protein NC652_000391 [Populus alba x Populus x berolinensis]
MPQLISPLTYNNTDHSSNQDPTPKRTPHQSTCPYRFATFNTPKTPPQQIVHTNSSGSNLQKKSEELYMRRRATFVAILEEWREGKVSDDDASRQEDFVDTEISNDSTDENITLLLQPELLRAGTDASKSAIEWS